MATKLSQDLTGGKIERAGRALADFGGTRKQLIDHLTEDVAALLPPDFTRAQVRQYVVQELRRRDETRLARLARLKKWSDDFEAAIFAIKHGGPTPEEERRVYRCGQKLRAGYRALGRPLPEWLALFFERVPPPQPEPPEPPADQALPAALDIADADQIWRTKSGAQAGPPPPAPDRQDDEPSAPANPRGALFFVPGGRR